MRWNDLSIPIRQRCSCWSLGMDKLFHARPFWVCFYSPMVIIKFIWVKWTTAHYSTKPQPPNSRRLPSKRRFDQPHDNDMRWKDFFYITCLCEVSPHKTCPLRGTGGSLHKMPVKQRFRVSLLWTLNLLVILDTTAVMWYCCNVRNSIDNEFKKTHAWIIHRYVAIKFILWTTKHVPLYAWEFICHITCSSPSMSRLITKNTQVAYYYLDWNMTETENIANTDSSGITSYVRYIHVIICPNRDAFGIGLIPILFCFLPSGILGLLMNI